MLSAPECQGGLCGRAVIKRCHFGKGVHFLLDACSWLEQDRHQQIERGGSNPCLREERKVEFLEEMLMPLIQVKVIEGVFTTAQKREMVRKLTDAMVSIEGENMRPVTWVVVEEVKSGDWGIGGQALTTADVQALAAGKSTG
jgi:4-oxalocrotonate tautomerase